MNKISPTRARYLLKPSLKILFGANGLSMQNYLKMSNMSFSMFQGTPLHSGVPGLKKWMLSLARSWSYETNLPNPAYRICSR